MVFRFKAKQVWHQSLFILLLLLCNAGVVKAQSVQYNGSNYGQYFNSQNTQWVAQNFENLRSLSQFNRAKDAGDGRNTQLRNEYVFGYAFMNAECLLDYRIGGQNYSSPDVFDSSISMTASPKTAFHIGAGSSYPLATVSKNGALTLSYEVSCNLIKWNLPDLVTHGDTQQFDVKTTTMAIPITIDFKSGAEAMLDRSKGSCFTIGIGVQPTLNMTTASDVNNGYYFSLTPAAKFEYGFATSFCTFKLRATGLLGKQQYAEFTDVRGSVHNHFYDISMNGSNQLILSLVIMPFTSQWENNEWYRGGR